jgi:hypothetical protein
LQSWQQNGENCARRLDKVHAGSPLCPESRIAMRAVCRRWEFIFASNNRSSQDAEVVQRPRQLDALKASEREEIALERIEKDLLDATQMLAARQRTERQLVEARQARTNQRYSASTRRSA